jgi:predicted O-methyltransferase YrrM
VDELFADLLVPPDPALDAVLAACQRAGLPPFQVSAHQGKLLHLLARLLGARSVLEVGTLGGYSTIWLARALPAGGRVVTLEANEKFAGVARDNFALAGVAEAVDLWVGPALDTLPQLASAGLTPFDLIFIDADRPNTPAYLRWAVELARPGGLVVLDNVVRGGEVLQAENGHRGRAGMHQSLRQIAAEPRVAATAIQTVGAKGWDGFVLALVGGESLVGGE